MKRLQLGKIPIELLEESVLRLTGRPSASVVTPPKAGLDFAAIRAGGRFILVSSDPVTGARDEIGTYAMNVSANDIATSGNRPQFAEDVVLLPEGSTRRDLSALTLQLSDSAERLGVSILGGHTEVTPGLRRPIVIVTAFSWVRGYITSGDAREGDSILITKTAGMEGTAVLARERKSGAISREVRERARGFLARLSVVEEAEAAYRTGEVHAMHDCTEGGVLGAVFEMSRASDLGFVLRRGDVPVAPETKAICGALELDPLKLIGSGAMILAVKAGGEGKVESALRGVCRVTNVGRFQKGRRLLVGEGGAETLVKTAPEDELWRALGAAT
jgi:hydrogenase expression/formation protein HypE